MFKYAWYVFYFVQMLCLVAAKLPDTAEMDHYQLEKGKQAALWLGQKPLWLGHFDLETFVL